MNAARREKLRWYLGGLGWQFLFLSGVWLAPVGTAYLLQGILWTPLSLFGWLLLAVGARGWARHTEVPHALIRRASVLAAIGMIVCAAAGYAIVVVYSLTNSLCSFGLWGIAVVFLTYYGLGLPTVYFGRRMPFVFPLVVLATCLATIALSQATGTHCHVDL